MTIEEGRWLELRARLGGFVGRRVGNPDDADDVVQEIFLRMHRGIGKLASSDRLDAWAFRIARNAIADYYRSLNRRVVPGEEASKILEGLAADPGDGQPPSDARAEMARCIAPMVRQLPDDYRKALELTELEGFTQATAAEKVGLSVSGMKSRVQRGRVRLREMLLRCCEIETDRRGRVVAFDVRGGGECAACGEGFDEPLGGKLDRPGERPRTEG